MTNIDRYSYCGTCQNSYFDKLKGHVCTRFDPLPNLEDGCLDFQLDNNKHSARKEPVLQKIDESLDARSTLIGEIKNEKGWFEYLVSDETNSGAIFSYDSDIVLRTSRRKKHMLLLSSIIFLGLPIALFSIDDYSGNAEALVGFALLIIFGLVALYHYIVNKVVVILTNSTIQLKGKKSVKWDHILFAYFEYDTKGNPRQEYLTLLLYDNTEIRTEISDLDLSKEELGQTIYHFLKNNKSN